MSTETMMSALGYVDEDLIEQYFVFGETLKAKKAKLRNNKRTRLASAVACLCLVVAVTFFAIYRLQDQNTIPYPEIVVDPDANGKPTTPHKVGLRCYSFYRGTEIRVDAFMSQMLADTEKDKIEGYPVFEVYPSTEDGRLKINGSYDGFEKRFSLDDLRVLVANSIEDSVFDGHSEGVLLDFSEFSPGETVTVTFSYGFFYYKNNPYSQTQPDNSWCGMRRSLYFYVGESGISVSSNSIEDAVSSYDQYCEKKMEIGQNPSEDLHCAAKGIYLKPLTEKTCRVPHGNQFLSQFEIVSSSNVEEYLVRVT